MHTCIIFYIVAISCISDDYFLSACYCYYISIISVHLVDYYLLCFSVSTACLHLLAVPTKKYFICFLFLVFIGDTSGESLDGALGRY